MKRIDFITAVNAVLFLFSAVCMPQASAAQNPEKLGGPGSAMRDQLIEREKTLSEAEKKRDRELYQQMLTDDFVSIGTDGKVHPKDEVLSDLPSTELAEYRPYNMQVVPLNDGAAIVTYDVIVRMVHYDDETPRYQHVSSVWVKQREDWKLKFKQATPVE